jgi:hypothetical protein
LPSCTNPAEIAAWRLPETTQPLYRSQYACLYPQGTGYRGLLVMVHFRDWQLRCTSRWLGWHPFWFHDPPRGNRPANAKSSKMPRPTAVRPLSKSLMASS